MSDHLYSVLESLAPWVSPDGVAAMGSAAAVAVALWLHFRDKRQGRALLRIYFIRDPPDWGTAFIRPRGVEGPSKVVFIRLEVGNNGPATARNVEAVVHDIDAAADSGHERIHAIRAMPLRWEDSDEAQLPTLVPKTRRRFEIGVMRPTAAGDGIELAFSLPKGRESTAYVLDMTKSYQLQVSVVAENAEAFTMSFSLGFFGKVHEFRETVEQPRTQGLRGLLPPWRRQRKKNDHGRR